MNPFYRVDNRLVHGQIISTWMPHLRLQRFLVVSDTVPSNGLQMTMFRMAIPQELEFMAMTVSEAAQWLNQKGFGQDRTMILLETIEDAARLFGAGHPFAHLNIGNVHHAPGRSAYTNAVYLGGTDIDLLRRLMNRGLRAEIQSLPTESPTDLRTVLEAG